MLTLVTVASQTSGMIQIDIESHQAGDADEEQSVYMIDDEIVGGEWGSSARRRQRHKIHGAAALS